MKQLFICLAGLLLFCNNAFSQYVLSGFEDWSGNAPQNWVTTNGLMALGNPQSVFKSSDPHSGNYACEIKTIHVVKKVPGFPIPDYTASIYTGTALGFNTIFGIPFSMKPSRMEFWYQYNARNQDSASIIVYTTRWNNSAGKRDTIAYAAGLITDSVGVYTKYSLPLNYLDTTNSPDSVVVLFASSTTNTQAEGARLLLDDIAFLGGNVGIAQTNIPTALQVYPNPCNTGVLHFSHEEITLFTYNLQNLQGTTLLSGKSDQSRSDAQINVSQLPSGVYLLQVLSLNKIYTGRVIIP